MVPVQAWRAERRVALGTTRCSRPRCWELVSRGLGHVRARRPLPRMTRLSASVSRRWQLGRWPSRVGVAVEVSKSIEVSKSRINTPHARGIARACLPGATVVFLHTQGAQQRTDAASGRTVQRTLRVSSRQHSARREWPHPVNGRILRLPHAGHPDEEQTYLLRHAAAKPTPRL